MSSNTDQAKRRLLIDKPIQWVDAGFNQSVKGLRFVVDDDQNLWSTPVLLAGVNPSETEVRVNSIGKPNSDTVDVTQIGILTRSINYVYNVTSNQFERIRTPSVFKHTGEITTDADIWDPGAGKFFRVLGGIITLAGPALAAASYNLIQFLDNATSFFQVSFYCPLAAASSSTIVIPVNFGPNGYKSTTAANVLRANFGSALTAGSCSISVWGCEETS